MTDVRGSEPEVAARRRVADVLARFEALDPEGLSLVGLPTPDLARRGALRQLAAAAAARAGRRELLAEATAAASNLVLVRFNESGYRPQPFGLNWLQSLGRPDDRAAIGLALVDAVAAAAVEDLLADDEVTELLAPFETLVVADLPASGATLVGLERRPSWARALLAGLGAILMLASLVAAIAAGSLVYIALALVPGLLIVAVLRSPPRSRT